MLHHAKVLTAMTGWVVSITLMAVATHAHALELCAWSLLIGMFSSMPTMWLIFDFNRSRLRDEFTRQIREERKRTDRLVIAVAQEFAEAELPRIDRRNIG